MEQPKKILFNKFLDDKKIYNLNVGYWRKKLQKGLAQKIELSEQPIQNKNEKGKNFYDGNPIFSYYSAEKNKALRIIQEDGKDLSDYPNMLLLDAWIDKLTLEKNTLEITVNELVISITLTQESVERCIQTVSDWFASKLTSANLDAYIVAANDFDNLFFPIINRLALSHEGSQPIRVLQHNLVHQFENTNDNFLLLVKKLVDKGLLKPGIKYEINDKAIDDIVSGHRQSPYVNNAGEIFIHETFLSYVWCISYALWTLYDEAVAKPSQNLHADKPINEINGRQISTSLEVFKYSLSLIKHFSIWDKRELPNPEYYRAEQSFYIEKSNSIFLNAMNFILCHELAHIELGHTQENIKTLTNQEVMQREKEADTRSIKLILQGVKPETKVTLQAGMLTGVCGMLFFRSKTKGTTHPDTDDRIDRLLTIIDAEETSPLWGMAALAFKLWDNQFEKLFDWATHNAGSYKELYYFVKKQIENENNIT